MQGRIPIVSKVVLAALLLFLCILSASAQKYQIRTRVDLVVVPVTVKAGSDRLISGLTKNDFVIFEDGKQQTITNFSIDPVPLSAAVIVDTGLTASSLAKVQQTFAALAGAFSEFDEVAVYRFDKYVAKVLDFSRELARAEEAMKTLEKIKPDSDPYPMMPSGPFSTQGPVINGTAVVPAGQIGNPPQPPKKIKVLNDAIFQAASDLAKRDHDRRKIVLVVSDGRTTGSDHSFDETVKTLLESGVQVYGIGMDLGFLSRKLSILDEYAKTTGGDSYFVNSLHALERSYARAAEQARNQYVLAYVSNNTVDSNRPIFRKIQVRLTRGDYETLHRTGYHQYP